VNVSAFSIPLTVVATPDSNVTSKVPLVAATVI
jgi:hypothetical protein